MSPAPLLKCVKAEDLQPSTQRTTTKTTSRCPMLRVVRSCIRSRGNLDKSSFYRYYCCLSSGRQILSGFSKAGRVLMRAKYSSTTGRAERDGEGLGKAVRAPPPVLVLSSQLTHLVTDAPGTKTEHPPHTHPAPWQHNFTYAGALLRRIVNALTSMLVLDRGTRWCTLFNWCWSG
jgi:hypothetical protein